MFLSTLEHLLRRRILLIALLAALAMLLLFWWGVSEAAGAYESGELSQGPRQSPVSESDMALGAVLLGSAAGSMLLTALAVILCASVLPEEFETGRISLWAALPISRTRLYVGSTAASLACSTGIGALLFGGVLLVTALYLSFTPTAPFLAAVSMVGWLAVIWSAVTTLSMVAGKIPAMLVTFGLCGIASFGGGMIQVGGIVPEVADSAVYSVASIFRMVFPADMALRGLLFGMMPAEGIVQEGMAFIGVSEKTPPWHPVYALLWAAVVTALGVMRFRRRDLP
jgi:ABC-type transport system involved in multi-copper enzyme maturation permease subunit